jgi:hypothetical protein
MAMPPEPIDSCDIEEIILAHGTRGMDRARAALIPGYVGRAAALLLERPGRVLIGTGFPVAGSFETDGPLGAIALYQALEGLGGEPVFICAPPISKVLATAFRTCEIPIRSWDETRPLAAAALAEIRPALIVSIERPGVAADGRYYNMRGWDITEALAKLDHLFDKAPCPTIAVGDGGNEIGMGNLGAALAGLPVTPSVTRCGELVVASVSNWGVYGILAAMSRGLGQDLLGAFDPREAAAWLVARGAVDGATGAAEPTEDGFPLTVGMEIIRRLREAAASSIRFSGVRS